LTGAFPPGASRCELVMDADAFPLDSRLPMLIPQLKRLEVGLTSSLPEYQDFFRQFLGSLERADVSQAPDLTLAVYDPLAPALPASAAIVLVCDPAPSSTLPSGRVTVAGNSLAAELNWSGLLANESLGLPPKPGDETLVWQGDRPLIFLRRNSATTLLVVNFDIRASNAPELPAFILLLHRFAEQIRAGKMADEARNMETNEAISVAADPRRGACVSHSGRARFFQSDAGGPRIDGCGGALCRRTRGGFSQCGLRR